MKFRTLFIFLCIGLSLSLFSCIDNHGNKDEKLVLKIDHIVIQPEAPYEFFNFLSNDLKLPVVWGYETYENFETGGVLAGNVNIESLDYEQRSNDSTISGIAFEPTLSTEETVKEMDAREINHYPVLNTSYGKVTGLKNLLPNHNIFFCEYTEAEAIKEKKKLKEQELNDLNGGTLGIQNVINVIIKFNAIALIHEWKKLLQLEQVSSTEYLYSESSPNIVFIKSDINKIESIKFKVNSLDQVRSYLAQHNMLGAEYGDTVSTNISESYGVLFQFSEND